MNAVFDHVVVGGGSAGAVLACRLSEDPLRRVLLLEAGGWDWSPYIHIPGFLANVVFSSSLNWGYVGEPDPTLGGRSLTWMAGRVLGGSSSINGMVYGRGLPSDYADWSIAGAEDWSWAAMQPWFRRLETWKGPAHPDRGVDGPIQVRPFPEVHPACRSVMDAYVAEGVPDVADYSVGISEGIGETQATQLGGWRHSTARGYLGLARRRRNLTIATGARAMRLVFDRERCTGVVYRRNSTQRTVLAAREVTVAAGAIGSPKLLLNSGVGPADALRALGLHVAHHRPGVGLGLNDHVNVKLSATVNLATYNSERHGLRKLVNGARFLLDGRGPAGSPANHVQGFVKSTPDLTQADHQVQVMAFAFHPNATDRADGVSVVVSACRPKARGRITLTSPDPLAPPRITFDALAAEEDVAILVRGCRMAREALQAGPGRKFAGRIVLPASNLTGDAAWIAFLRETAALNWHPTSTCRMGADDDAVVDGRLRVRGLESLSVVDASIMPNVTSGNTNAPVIAIAERASAMIAERTA